MATLLKVVKLLGGPSIKLFAPHGQRPQYAIQHKWNPADNMLLLQVQPTLEKGYTLETFLAELQQKINRDNQRVFLVLNKSIPSEERRLIQSKFDELKTGKPSTVSAPLTDRILYIDLSSPPKMEKQELPGDIKVTVNKEEIQSHLEALVELTKQAYWFQHIPSEQLKENVRSRIQECRFNDNSN